MTVAFALVVVHEKGYRGWWLPGGGVDAGQTFAEAAVREAEEEAGVDCVLTGVLRVECCGPDSGRLRVIFHGRPRDSGRPLKSKADHHSKGARWVTLPELDAIAESRRGVVPGVPDETCYLRGEEPLEWFHYLSNGGPVHPLATLHFARLGKEPEWDGIDDPPRAVYPTAFKIALLCVHEGQVAMSSGCVPSVDVSSQRAPLNQLANAFAEKLGVGPITGVAKIRHVLDLRTSEQQCFFQVLYWVKCTAGGPPANFSWSPLGSLQRIVVAHNNMELRQHVEAWAEREAGRRCRIFDKDEPDAAVQVLEEWEGATLLCTSTFPLFRLPANSNAVVWSKTAAQDVNERARLLAQGATYVAPIFVDPTTPEALAALFGAIDAVDWPGNASGMPSLPLQVLDLEGAKVLAPTPC